MTAAPCERRRGDGRDARVIRLSSMLERSARWAATHQAADGSLAPGHNGPWGDRETPLRNTGGWLLVFLWAYEHTGKTVYRRAAERAARYLMQEEHRPGKGAFVHQPDRGRLAGNGLVGQAWTLRSLLEAHRVLQWEELREIAVGVARLHAFDEVLGLWSSLGVAGESLGVNTTLNQQIWFASSVSLLASHDEGTRRKLRRFMDCLPSHVRSSPTGRIEHRIHPRSLWRRFPTGWRSYLTASRHRGGTEEQRSIGYHAFCLFGLGLLAPTQVGGTLPRLAFVPRAMNYAESFEYRRGLEGNPFAYGYNPTGFEMAFALVCFLAGVEDKARSWVREQIRRSYDLRTGLMTRHSPDPPTLAARIWEAMFLPDWEIDVA